jgi:bleomycin hydrolase
MHLDDDFELSQNHLMFWDKLEKANYFLESVLLTLDEPTEGRLVSHLLKAPVQDGGQWHMFVNLVRKYGVVPKTVMPETDSSGNTRELNYHLTYLLREAACRMRRAHRDGADLESVKAMKGPVLTEAYRMLTIHLGLPPRDFFWQWRDRDEKHHREGTMTPLRFYEKFVGSELSDLVCLIHCPQESKELNTLYTIRYLGNVVAGEPIKYLNVDIEVMKTAAANQIKSGESVWFGCDVGKHLDRDAGLMDVDLFEYELVYGRAPELSKAERLDYGHAQMTHAMVFTGVDLDGNDRPLKWRVENSWGDKVGDDGFMQMTDKWFDEHNYEVVVRKRYVPEDLWPVLDTEPVALDPWDPMGALAC